MATATNGGPSPSASASATAEVRTFLPSAPSSQIIYAHRLQWPQPAGAGVEVMRRSTLAHLPPPWNVKISS
jgi:hypothetical protein